MDSIEFSRLNSFLETERKNSIENNEKVMSITRSEATARSSLATIAQSTVSSLTAIFNASAQHETDAPMPPPRRKKSVRKTLERNKVHQIASRFERNQLQYQTDNCDMKYNELIDTNESTSYQSSGIEETKPISDVSLISIEHSQENVSSNTPLPEEKNISTVFRFKDATKTLPRPKTDGKPSARNIFKYNSYHPGDEEEAVQQTDEIQYRPKELMPKEVKPIIDELIKTEETYVENLRVGLKNYEPMFDRTDLPAGLRGKKFVLLGNIEQLLEFHETQFLPMLRKERHDITRLFHEFVKFLDDHYFYSYVIYTMNKKRSLQLCDVYKQYFKELQEELGDKLGIMSFLVQPIQRLARYPLLLNTFNSKLFKVSAQEYKSVLAASGKVEKRLKDLCITTNESEQINDIVDSNDFNVFYQGHFKKLNDFNCFDYTKRRGYQSRLFLFDKCVIYTEIVNDKRLIFRGCYPCEHIGVIPKPNSLTLFYAKRKMQECTFKADHDVIQNWAELIQDMIKGYAKEEQLKWKTKIGSDKRTNLAFFRNSNRFSSDSGIGDMWQPPKVINDIPENISPRTTWYMPS